MTKAELQTQVANLLQAIEDITWQVTKCAYCGNHFAEGEQRERDTSTNSIVHVACLESIAQGDADAAQREMQAERRNEEALYGYEIDQYWGTEDQSI